MGQARRGSEMQEHEDENSSVGLASERSWALAGEGHAGLWGEAKPQRVIEPAALGRDALHIQAAPPPAIPGLAAFPLGPSAPCLAPACSLSRWPSCQCSQKKTRPALSPGSSHLPVSTLHHTAWVQVGTGSVQPGTCSGPLALVNAVRGG